MIYIINYLSFLVYVRDSRRVKRLKINQRNHSIIYICSFSYCYMVLEIKARTERNHQDMSSTRVTLDSLDISRLNLIQELAL